MTLKYENKKILQGYTSIIGCDEAGRGSLAGPVVAAAVILPVADNKQKALWQEIKDSKLLAPKKREELSCAIKDHCLAWGVGQVDEKTIDEINIHKASLLAMRRAVENLQPQVSSETKFLAVDGKFQIPGLSLAQEAVVDGDNKILSIAAASIIAKVFRDRLMRRYHNDYPQYNFAKHKGYATLYHRTMILKHGLSKIHRLSFCNNFI